MDETAKIETTARAEAAYGRAGTRDADDRKADRVVGQVGADPLTALLDATAAAAKENGLSEEEVAKELALYNAERRG